MIRVAARAALVALVLFGVVQVATGVAAQSNSGNLSGPALTVNPSVVDPGQRVDVIFTNWEARLATLSVCGNLAKRGSADCNQVASQGVTLRGIGVTEPVASFVVTPPAGTCPCVIRAAGTDTNELAIAPIEIIGHPVGPLTEAFSGATLEVGVDAQAAPDGFLATVRSLLGGETDYDVTVTVRNIATETFDNVDVFGSVGRSATEDQAIFELLPEPIPPGQTWTGEATVAIPAPLIGDYLWQVTASGAGPPARAEEPMRAIPWLLLLLVVVLIGDVVFMVARWLRRRAQRREDELLAQADGEGGENGPPRPDLSTLPPPPVLVS